LNSGLKEVQQDVVAEAVHEISTFSKNSAVIAHLYAYRRYCIASVHMLYCHHYSTKGGKIINA